MRKTIIALSLLCGNVYADTNVFGSMEQEFRITSDDTDIGTDDTYIGLKFNEELNSEFVGYSNMSLKLKPYADEDIVTVRDAYVGLKNEVFDVRIGRMKSLQAVIGNDTVDIFNAGNRVIDVDQKGRNDKTIQAQYKFNDFTLLGSVISDENESNAYEIGASSLIYDVNVHYIYAKNDKTQTDTHLIAAKYELDALTIAASYENDTMVGSNDVASFNISSSIDIDDNTYAIGYHDNDEHGSAIMAEATHPFSESMYSYISYKKAKIESTLTIGFGVKF